MLLSKMFSRPWMSSNLFSFFFFLTQKSYQVKNALLLSSLGCTVAEEDKDVGEKKIGGSSPECIPLLSQQSSSANHSYRMEWGWEKKEAAVEYSDNNNSSEIKVSIQSLITHWCWIQTLTSWFLNTLGLSFASINQCSNGFNEECIDLQLLIHYKRQLLIFFSERLNLGHLNLHVLKYGL